MQDKIKEIRDACISANPSILDLKFGCEVNMIDIEDEREMAPPRRFPAICVSRREDRGWWFMSKMCMDDAFFIDNHPLDLAQVDMKIIGRPIRLADVLLAIGEKYKGREINYYKTNEFSVLISRYNLLKDDLNLQEEDTINFLHLILCPKK